MKLTQLSVFLENKPGRLSVPCRALANAGINIVTLSLADTHQFGILRLIVRDWQRAKQVLEQAGCVVNTTEVVAINMEDRPGGLAKILEVTEKANINIEYMYAFSYRNEDLAVLISRFENPDGAIEALRQRGVDVISSVELFDRLDKQEVI